MTLHFEFADADGIVRPRTFADPVEVIVAHQAREVRPALRAVERAVAAGFYAAGYVAYEAAPAFDAAFAVNAAPTIPLLWFGVYAVPAAAPRTSDGAFSVSAWQPATSEVEYAANIAAVRAAIARGDTYQANYTLRLRAQFAGDDLAFYRRLHAAQNASYCAYLSIGRYRILSASPELFFHWDGQRIITKPMKGTVRRGRWPAEDEERAAWLAASEKDRAENLMIVDLLRNDVGRIATIGSVQVPHLFAVEPYRTVFQMTSTVAARTRPGTTLTDVFSALFPCGSITGAPKIETMKLISRLEDAPRNVYCGSIGFVAPDGTATFNVAIRTVLLDITMGAAEYGVGGGVTYDSTASGEYAEALAKAALLTEEWPSFALLETLRLERGAYTLLERHIERLAASARYFAIPLDEMAVRAALAAHAQVHAAGAWRVRLLVAQDGTAQLAHTPLDAPPAQPQPVALAATPVSRDDRFLFHKTTHRAAYETRRAARPDVFDVLLWNEQGELTEFTIGNLVVEIAGQRWTPPLSCGLLAGTLRAELLARGAVRERVLTRADLAATTQIWLINSVRGWVPVYLVSSRALG